MWRPSRASEGKVEWRKARPRGAPRPRGVAGACMRLETVSAAAASHPRCSARAAPRGPGDHRLRRSPPAPSSRRLPGPPPAAHRLPPTSYRMPHAACHPPPATCRTPHATLPHIVRRTPHAARRTPLATRRPPHAARRTPHVVRRTPLAARLTPHAARRTPHATSWISRARGGCSATGVALPSRGWAASLRLPPGDSSPRRRLLRSLRQVKSRQSCTTASHRSCTAAGKLPAELTVRKRCHTSRPGAKPLGASSSSHLAP